MRAVSPLLRDALLLVIATVGATVSIVIGGESDPATFVLPAASVNLPAATETLPDRIEFAVGTNVAV